jgi:hypothetical protein
LQDVGVSLFSGQNPLTVGVQQGSQIFDIYSSSGVRFKDVLSQIGGIAASVITPISLITGGVVALGVAAAVTANQYDKMQVSAQRAISGSGQRTGTSVSDINAFTSQNSSLSGTSLSSKEARGLAEDFTKTGEIVISRLHGMSDAVVGFANQSGKSIDEARKDIVSFAVDPQKGLEELSKTYGSFDAATRKAVDALVLADDKTGAFQVVIDALSEKSKAAAGNMGVLEKATRSVVNVLSTETSKPVGLEQQLENVRGKLNAAINSSSDPFARDSGEAAHNVEVLSREFEGLQQAMEKVKAANASAEFNKLSTAADGADQAIIPQIAQLEQLRAKIEDLNRAKAAGATSKYGADVDSAALTAAQNQEQALVQSEAAAARYNDRIKQISASWGDVGQSTALSLQAAQNQLPVIEAVGGAAKMAAQYTADFANAMDQGKTATEAAALAASNLRAHQAAVNSSAQETLASLRDQAAVASASNPQQAIQAQAQATYNKLVRDGVDANVAEGVAIQGAANQQAQLATAQAIADQQRANALQQIYIQNEKVVQSSKDQVALYATQGTAEQASVKAAIAYRNAIDAGADSTQAAIIANNTAAVATAQWADQAQRLAQAYEDATRAAEAAQYADAGGSFGSFQRKDGIEGNTAYAVSNLGQLINAQMIALTSGILNGGVSGLNLVSMYDSSILGSDALRERAQRDQAERDALAAQAKAQSKPPDYGAIVNAAYSSGGIDAAIKAAQNSASQDSNSLQTVDQLYQFKNGGTSDTKAQASNLKEELAWLNTQPVTLARDVAIRNLDESIKKLTDSTDGLTGALLSPYYDQDPRKTHIGFRSQGMATGGELTVPGGYSANDNMLAQIPVASGEIVSVRRPGQNLGGSTQNISISLGGITVNSGGPADANAIGRTVYQAMQTATRQLQAAGR